MEQPIIPPEQLVNPAVPELPPGSIPVSITRYQTAPLLTFQPAFYFSIKEICEKRLPGLPGRCSRQGSWLPPKALGTNVPAADYGEERWFYHDHRGTFHVQDPTQTQPQRSEHYRICSVYHDRSVLRAVPFDVTGAKVGDGLHTTDEGDDGDTSDEEESGNQSSKPWTDWKEISFHWGQDSNGAYYSYVTLDGGKQCLCIEHPQRAAWVRQLLPTRYRALRVRQRQVLQNDGSMIGELPVILALYALSVEPEHVDDTFRTCVLQPHWQQHPTNHREVCKCLHSYRHSTAEHA